MMNMKTKIYGGSDDLIEIEGPINDEYDAIDFKGKIQTSDGTITKLKYDGDWKFEIISKGDKFIKIIESVGEDFEHNDVDALNCSSYSDVLVLDDGIEWVKIGRKKYKI